MAIKTEDTVRTNIIRAVNSSQPGLTTRVGSVVRDVLINPTAYEFGSIYSELSDVSNAQSIWTARGDSILSLASNYLIYPTVATQAYGAVTFYSTQEPTADITIPQGTIVATRIDSNNVILRYTTVQTVGIPLANVGDYYNSDTGNWEVSVLVIAENGGSKYNVAANTIVTINATISGINGVYNVAEISGGAEEETVESVAYRVTQKLAGVNAGTMSGYSEAVFAIDGVQDVLVIGPRDTNMTRKSIGGVDIFVKGTLPISVAMESYTFTSTVIPDFIVNSRPIITSTPGTINNQVGTWDYGIDWEWSKDITSSLQSSVQSLDKVHWLTLTPPVSADGPLFVSYTYNGLISTIQSSITADDKKVITADVLIKWASPVLINVECEIRVVQNYYAPDVQTAVELAVTTLLDGYYLGQEVQQSDILAAINAVDGVYDVKNTLILTTDPVLSGQPDATYNNIVIPSHLYAQAGTITVTQRNS